MREPESQPLRHLQQIEAVLDGLPLSRDVVNRSLRAFYRLAEAEAAVHGVDRESIHFHEVGASDTLVDVVGAFWAVERLGVSRVVCSELPWFEGSVDCEHGRLPLPAPATLELLKGKPVYPTRFREEIITPTGALILDQLAQTFQQGFSGCILRSGTGWGSLELEEAPNGLRAILFQGQEAERERIVVLESAMDHLTGEEMGNLYQELFRAGALDVIYFPGVMKKNRPAGMLQVLAPLREEAEVQRAFFRQSLTLGIRRREMERLVAPRRQTKMTTPWGPVEAKEVGRVRRPEFEDLRRLSRETGYSVAELRCLLQDRGESDQKG